MPINIRKLLILSNFLMKKLVRFISTIYLKKS
jgi:hypothetical protein